MSVSLARGEGGGADTDYDSSVSTVCLLNGDKIHALIIVMH